MQTENIEKKLGSFSELCRSEGIKATHQRMEIMRTLAATEEHPDAESVYREVKQRIPTISLDTVYRTLRMFEEKGLIARVGSVRDRARFDANTEHHHHFVCTQCGMVRDFYSEALDSLSPPSDIGRLGEVDGVYVELRGVCRNCREKSKTA